MIAKIASMVTRILLAIGSAVLAMMMFLTAVDVLLRYLFNRPIAGAFELVEFMMAIFIPFSIVYCAEQKSHVAVELILRRFPESIQNILDTITSLVTMIFAVIIAWQNYLYIGEMFNSQMTSSVLLIPVYPFVASVAVGITAFALVLLPQWLDRFRSN